MAKAAAKAEKQAAKANAELVANNLDKFCTSEDGSMGKEDTKGFLQFLATDAGEPFDEEAFE